MEIDREIFDAVYKLLEAQGLTQQWKAQIRTEVINTIENEQRIVSDDAEAPTPNSYQRLRKLYKTPETRLAFDLIFELLDHLTLTYTESVLKAETDIEDVPKSRSELFEAFENFSEEDSDVPVLVQLVRKYMKEEIISQQESNQTYEESTFVNSSEQEEPSEENDKTPEKSQLEGNLPNDTYVVTTPTIDEISSSSQIQEDIKSPSSTEK
ncbi:hypothetical protein DMENIID0001_026760 [Sergentomyia squamirostris]